MRLTQGILLVLAVVIVAFRILLAVTNYYLHLSPFDILVGLIGAIFTIVQLGYNAMPSLYVRQIGECKEINYGNNNSFYVPYIGPNSEIKIRLSLENELVYLVVGNAGPGVASKVNCNIERRAEQGSHVVKILSTDRYLLAFGHGICF